MMDTTAFDSSIFAEMNRGYEKWLGVPESRKRTPMESSLDMNEEQSCESKNAKRAKTADLVEAQALAAKFENENKILHLELTESRITWEKEEDNFKSKIQLLSEEVKELSERLLLAKRSNSILSNSAWQQKNERLESQMSSMREKNCQLNEKVSQQNSDLINLKMVLNEGIMKMQDERDELKMDLVEKNSLLNVNESLREEISSLQIKLNDFQKKTQDANIDIIRLKQEISSFESDRQTVNLLKEQLEDLKELQVENSKLKEENTDVRLKKENLCLLSEEVRTLRNQMQDSNDKLSEYEKLKIECEEMKAMISNWETVNIGEGVNTPTKTVRLISDLQKKEAVQLEHQGRLIASNHSLQSTLKLSTNQMHEFKSKLLAEQQKNCRLNDVLKKIKLKNSLLSLERNSLRKLLTEYEKTESVSPQATRRIKELEAVVEAHQATIENELKVSEEIALSTSITEPITNAVKSALISSQESECNIILSLREELTEVQRRLEDAIVEKEKLAEKLHYFCNDICPEDAKILHLKMNPAEMARKEKAEEMISLKKKVAKLEKAMETQLSASCIANISEIETKTKQDLDKEIKSLKLLNQRMMEMFKKTSADLRLGIFELLGYRIDIQGCRNESFKFTSAYASSADHYLIFKKQDGKFSLIDTEFGRTLHDKIDIYLKTEDCIPAFLSSVTLDLCSVTMANNSEVNE